MTGSWKQLREREIGNLTQDTKEGITGIEWNGAGKVTKVVKGTTSTISFLYDAMGNRVRKFVSNPNKTTYYVRDASGNVMATYEKVGTIGTIKQIEVPLYGSDRVGMAKRSAERGTFTATDTSSRWLDYKMYELKDHLGNVRVVLGDKKTRTTGTNPFQPDVVSYSGYFPFGMQMQEDTWQSPLYRYGYNGHEKDVEITSEGNHLSFGDYGYDPRIGRRWNIEPATRQFPDLSGYVTFNDNPIMFSDPTGKFSVMEHIFMTLAAWQKVHGPLTGLPTIVTLITAAKKLNEISNHHFDADLTNSSIEAVHLDNFTNSKFNELFKNNGYYNLATHTLQDFYCHTNYIEIMIELGYTKQNMPTINELDNSTRREVMKKIRSTNNNVSAVGILPKPYPDNNATDHTKTKKFEETLAANGVKFPGNSDFFFSKHSDHPYFELAYDLGLRATVFMFQNSGSDSVSPGGRWVDTSPLDPGHWAVDDNDR